MTINCFALSSVPHLYWCPRDSQIIIISIATQFCTCLLKLMEDSLYDIKIEPGPELIPENSKFTTFKDGLKFVKWSNAVTWDKLNKLLSVFKIRLKPLHRRACHLASKLSVGFWFLKFLTIFYLKFVSIFLLFSQRNGRQLAKRKFSVLLFSVVFAHLKYT